MISAEIAAEIVSLAHRAALDTEQWPHVLRRLARAVDGGSAILVDYDLTTLTARHAIQYGADAAFVKRTLPFASKLNPQILPMSHRPAGSVAADYMLMPHEALRESEFYHAWFKPQHVRWSMACSLWRSEERIAVIAIRRHGRTQPRFGAEDLKLVERITPHLGHAAALDARLRRLEFERDAAFDGLSRFCDGVVIVDSTHRILFANAAAERLLDRAHPLHVRDGKLFTRHGPMASKLTNLIGRATSADLGCRSAGAMSMLRNGPIPLSIVATPVGEMEGTFAPIRCPVR